MKFLLAAIILLNVLNLSAQKPRFNFSQGLAGSLSYANQLYGDGDGGVKAEFGYLTQLSVGRRLRGRIGIGGSVIINSSKNNYQNTLNRTSRFAFNRDTSFSLRAGSFTIRFVALGVPLEYRYVSDGRIPWTAGITYKPGFILLKSVENTFTQYDWAWASDERLNESSEITEQPSISRFTDAISLNMGYETERFLLRLTIGRDQWDYQDDYIGGESRWLFGVEIVKWLRSNNKKER